MAAEQLIDLRSDTVTRPTPAMRAAMAQAPVGDDVYGEDPTVTALEAQVAALLGHEAGLFCPTGSLANMLGVRQLVGVGQELLCDSLAHVVRAELGGHAAFGQVTTRTWSAPGARRPAGGGGAVGHGGPGRWALPGLDGRDRGGEHAQLRRRHRATVGGIASPAPGGG